jgi:hypothetical protein
MDSGRIRAREQRVVGSAPSADWTNLPVERCSGDARCQVSGPSHVLTEAPSRTGPPERLLSRANTVRTLRTPPRRSPTLGSRTARGRWSFPVWAGPLVLSAVGCGGAHPARGASLSLDPESELAQAERELHAALEHAPSEAAASSGFASPPDGVGVSGQQPRPAAPSPPAPPEPSREEANDHQAESKTAPSAPRDACSTACDAGSSIARAVERICELDDPGGARCERARSRLEDARARLSRQCPSCTP